MPLFDVYPLYDVEPTKAVYGLWPERNKKRDNDDDWNSIQEIGMVGYDQARTHHNEHHHARLCYHNYSLEMTTTLSRMWGISKRVFNPLPDKRY